MKKGRDAADYKFMTKVCPEMEKELTYEEFKMGKALASLRAYDLAFTDGIVR